MCCPGDVNIRRAGPSDFAKVAEMHYPVWRRSWSGMVEDFMLDLIATPTMWVEVTYPLKLSQPGWSMWVAEARGKMLGMAVFGPAEANADDLQIEALYTAPDARKLGIGVRLLKKAESSNPSSDLVLWCAEENREARKFYEDNNFRPDGRTLVWTPLPGVSVPHVGYRLHRSPPED
jgi:GNAT superfamily N-acetyltransferase